MFLELGDDLTFYHHQGFTTGSQARIIDGKATLEEGKSKKAIAFLVRPVAFLVGSEKN
jgi:hypothetical protein